MQKFVPAAAIIEEKETKPKTYGEYMSKKDIENFSED